MLIEAGGCREVAADTATTHDRVDDPDKGDDESLEEVWIRGKIGEEIPPWVSPFSWNEDLLERMGSQQSYSSGDGRIAIGELSEEPDNAIGSTAAGGKSDI